MKKFFKHIFIISLLVLSFKVVNADESKIDIRQATCITSSDNLEFNGNIYQAREMYDNESVYPSDLVFDGTLYYKGAVVDSDDIKLRIFTQELIDNNTKISVKVIIEVKNRMSTLVYNVVIDVVPFNNTLTINDNSINLYNINDINNLDIAYTNSLGQIVKGESYIENRDKIHYGYNETYVKFNSENGLFKDVRFPITLYYSANDVTVKATKKSISVTRSKYLEYSLDKKKWQDDSIFLDLERNKTYTIYIRTKATGKFDAGKIIKKTITTK